MYKKSNLGFGTRSSAPLHFFIFLLVIVRLYYFLGPGRIGSRFHHGQTGRTIGERKEGTAGTPEESGEEGKGKDWQT